MDDVVTKISSKEYNLGSLMPKNGVVSNQPISNEIIDKVSSKTTLFSDSFGSAEEAIEDTVEGWSWWYIAKIVIGIFILAFLGFNIFNYLGKATENITNIIRPLVKLFSITTGETIKEVTNMTTTGMKGSLDIVADTIDNSVDILEKGIDGNITRNNIETEDVEKNNGRNDDNLDNLDILDDLDNKIHNEPEPDKAGSRTQNYKPSGKSGFCYIGEDRGFRSCIKIGDIDKCMSGEIFPSKELCINPNLRE